MRTKIRMIMNSIAIKILAIILMTGSVLNAQDPQFTQIYATPLYTCPSFAGSTMGSRAVMNFRDQWPAIPGAFVTCAFSYDQFIPAVNSGVGFLLLRDWAGSGRLGTMTTAVQYTYNIRAARYIHVRPSIQFAYGQRSIDFNRLKLGNLLYAPFNWQILVLAVWLIQKFSGEALQWIILLSLIFLLPMALQYYPENCPCLADINMVSMEKLVKTAKKVLPQASCINHRPNMIS